MNMILRLIVSEIAERYGVSEAEVLRDMREAVEAGRRSSEPEVQEVWTEIPKGGDLVENTIQYVIDRLLKRGSDLR